MLVQADPHEQRSQAFSFHRHDAFLSEFLWLLVIKHKRRLLIPICLTLALGILFLVAAPPRYTATAALVVDPKRSQLFPPESVPDALVDIAVVESQVETLKSERIALAVIRKLHLADDAEFVVEPAPEQERLQRVLAAFKRRLSVRRLGQSYVTEISFTSRDKERAAAIANEVANAYIQNQLDMRIEQSRQAGTWLQGRLQELLQQMSDALRAVETFKSENAAATREGQVKLRGLEAEAQTYKTIYEGFLSRYVQTIQQQSFPITDARMVTDAMPPLTPSWPKPLVVLAIALLAGGAVGLAWAFVREQQRRDGVMRQASQAARQ